jgi:molybdopterin-guanine dinucleotide biosynthesis protein A
VTTDATGPRSSNVAPVATAPLPPLYGLVLAGGASRRMRTDKAALEYHGKPQLERAYELLDTYCEQTFVSVRRDQGADPLRARFPQIVDTQHDLGPIAGIAAAQARHPDVAWLVLACDLPLVTPAALERLIAARRRDNLAVAYRSVHDGLPEPLCAIYEPAATAAVAASIATQRTCPRKMLIRLEVPLLEPEWRAALDNVNTPEEYAAAQATLAGPSETVRT